MPATIEPATIPIAPRPGHVYRSTEYFGVVMIYLGCFDGRHRAVPLVGGEALTIDPAYLEAPGP